MFKIFEVTRRVEIPNMTSSTATMIHLVVASNRGEALDMLKLRDIQVVSVRAFDGGGILDITAPLPASLNNDAAQIAQRPSIYGKR